mmetsp:Transcript_118099/g.345923  ORF Transcript_118099/g.345923 Transcript_118099/m.345923 type:complete len:230 (-) Transcript_118099:848-1537(-)
MLLRGVHPSTHQAKRHANGAAYGPRKEGVDHGSASALFKLRAVAGEGAAAAVLEAAEREEGGGALRSLPHGGGPVVQGSGRGDKRCVQRDDVTIGGHRPHGQRQGRDLDPRWVPRGVGVVELRLGLGAVRYEEASARVVLCRGKDLPDEVPCVHQGHHALPQLFPRAAALGVLREDVPHALEDVNCHRDSEAGSLHRKYDSVPGHRLSPTDSKVHRWEAPELLLCCMEG